MLIVDIPGRGEQRYAHLLLDYNGTIALDGALVEGVARRLEELSRQVHIAVITADTHGTAARACAGLPVKVMTYPTAEVGKIKGETASRLTGGVIAVGNGFNDVQMAERADLSVCVMGPEGCYGPLMARCDVVVPSILDALDLLLKPNRLRATLRT